MHSRTATTMNANELRVSAASGAVAQKRTSGRRREPRNGGIGSTGDGAVDVIGQVNGKTAPGNSPVRMDEGGI